jgi:hypothetical protein
LFFTLPESAAHLPDELQTLLDEHQPLPQSSITRFCNLAAGTGDTERDASFRRLVVDVDALLMDLRWSIGQALLIIRAFPDLEKPLNETSTLLDRLGMPNRVWVLLRPLLAQHERIFYTDLMERRPGGGTVGGWMLHLLVEDAVSRAIGVLDRIAHLMLLAADLPAPRGRMYFRSGKFEILRDSHAAPIPGPIFDLAKGDELSFLLDYRDGLAHTVRPMTRVMRDPPVDEYGLEGGQRVRQTPISWTAADLVGLAVLGFHVCCEALPHAAQFCETYIVPRSDT